MKREDIDMALNQISDQYIAEAAAPRRQRKKRWWSLAAAAMAFVLLFGFFGRPMVIRAQAVSLAEYPEYQWKYREEVKDDVRTLVDFFEENIETVLSGSNGENHTYSPINLYMAMSIVAELASDTSREQILSLLGVGNIEALRVRTNEIWNACYRDDKDTSRLANSVWLDDGLAYNQAVMDRLATNYYTSVYQAELSDPKTVKDIHAWLNQNTGNLLKKEVENAASGFDQNTLLAIYSTVLFQAKWAIGTEFSPSRNTDETFHAPGGDVTCTFMNHKLMQTNYYWAEDCSAVSLGLRGPFNMWFILPDEGVTVDDVLASGNYMDLIMNQYEEGVSGEKYMKVNLSIPKFDVRWSSDLKDSLVALGVTDVFSETLADFSESIQGPIYLTGVNQSTRVCIDEEGVTAASYIEIPGATSPMPPEEIIDFVVDRPFIFIIKNSYGIPLFAGVVNDPTKQ